ncbi:MAG: macro domain-containing protein [Acidobacteria bacterium]|nr:macro domain-containing protein [Acidobacteriota bacterium]
MPEAGVEHTLPGERLLRIMQGDLTEQEVDAIVNAANSQLAHGGGVAGAIVRKGGRIIQEESDRLAPVPVGETAVTSAGALRARHVIHAVGPVWGEGDEDRKLGDAFRNSLLRASEIGCRSVAIPAISSGIFGFPKERCARIFVDVVEGFFVQEPGSSLREVRSVNIDVETVAIFMREAARRAPVGE